MKYPIEAGNVALIILGVVLVISGPVIIYRTCKDILHPKAGANRGNLLFSSLLNFVIAVLFVIAGILFVVNNLRGNPLT